jgi:hypothetical protein
MSNPATDTADRWETHASVAAVAAAYAAYLLFYLRFLPSSGADWGDDYALHFPNLVAGCYWFLKNGAFAVPWFSPGQCGGVPYLADLNVAYYSVPQWATFVAGPIPAVRFTFAAFAAIGAGGAWLLARRRFGLSAPASACAAVLFLFSTFYSVRMVIGHITFHPFTLTPLLAWAALSASAIAAPVLAGGLILAYMFHAGMVHGIPPALFALAVIFALHGQRHGHGWRPWIILAAAGALSLGLSAQRLAAALAFLAQFPRADYPLPGFPDLLDAAKVALQAIFWRGPAYVGVGPSAFANPAWTIEHHEWAFTVGPAALVALLAGAWSMRNARRPPASRLLVWAAVAAALAVPVLLNWHYPPWNAFLKSLPFFGSSSNLTRWFAAYVPVVALCAALALDRAVVRPVPRRFAAAGMIAATVASAVALDDIRFYERTYDAAPGQVAWEAARDAAAVPAVTRITMAQDSRGRPMRLLDRNDSVFSGGSQSICYQPMFGYLLERMPVGFLREGGPLQPAGASQLNVKNPACYTYPQANGCLPGDHFMLPQRAEAERFLDYRPFAFEQPAWQRAASGISLAAALVALGLAVGLALRAVLSAIARRKSR